ncbi:MAG: hypothetical protein JRF25_10270 [Deltaproteobacteria bacterium]|nr:hypothetical protein [Deltaproteobacteria bacterium]
MLNNDYKEMLEILLNEKVDFILVGAYALAAHGFPRATGDIDIWVKPDHENSRKTYSALIKFGAPISQIREDEFNRDGIVFQIGVVPRRIDIITAIDGVEFDEADEEKVMLEVEDLKLPVISVKMLIKNKKATGREKDLLDAKLLEKNLNSRK